MLLAYHLLIYCRIGTVFSYLASHLSVDLGPDESIFVLLEAFWPMLEKLLMSDHIESGSLSTAACRALTLAIQASGFNNVITYEAKTFLFHNLSFCVNTIVKEGLMLITKAHLLHDK